MKIRNSFVSNSSSSSFIISDNDFHSVRELAKYMLGKIIGEEEEEEPYDNQYLDFKKKLIERLNNIDENASVSFSSCNYDTYIKKVEDVYLVSTCNNTRWDLYSYATRLTPKAKLTLIEMAEKDNDLARTIGYILDEYSDFSAIGQDYYNLDNEIIGVECNDKCDNKIHQYSQYMWDTQRWGKICLICNPIFQRKDKLEKINNESCQ